MAEENLEKIVKKTNVPKYTTIARKVISYSLASSLSIGGLYLSAKYCVDKLEEGSQIMLSLLPAYFMGSIATLYAIPSVLCLGRDRLNDYFKKRHKYN